MGKQVNKNKILRGILIFLIITGVILGCVAFILHFVNKKEGFSNSSNKINYGIWCMNQNCLDQAMIPRGVKRVYVGAFEGDGDGIPKKVGGGSDHMTDVELEKIKKLSGADEIFVTVGGNDAVEANAENLIKLYNEEKFHFTGLDFDNEGLLKHNSFETFVADTVTKVSKGIGKPLDVQFTILAGDKTYDTYLDDYNKTKKKFLTQPTIVNSFKIALMLYGTKMDDSNWGLSSCGATTNQTATSIAKWINSGIKPSDIILGMTPALQNNKCYFDYFSNIVTKKGLAGINFWQAGTVCSVIGDAKISSLKCSSSPIPVSD
jgi:hypothetical protein